MKLNFYIDMYILTQGGGWFLEICWRKWDLTLDFNWKILTSIWNLLTKILFINFSKARDNPKKRSIFIWIIVY